MIGAGVLLGTKGLRILGAVGSTVGGRETVYGTLYGTVYSTLNRAPDIRLGGIVLPRSTERAGNHLLKR